MNRLQYLLNKLAEEACEVGQISLKTAQFGLDEVYQHDSNRERMHKEINDFLGVVELLNKEFGFGFSACAGSIAEKEIKINKYWQYSKDLGMVVDV